LFHHHQPHAGVDCALALRRWEASIGRQHRQRICAVSSHTSAKEKRTKAAGFDHYQTKPVRRDDLLAIARDATSSQSPPTVATGQQQQQQQQQEEEQQQQQSAASSTSSSSSSPSSSPPSHATAGTGTRTAAATAGADDMEQDDFQVATAAGSSGSVLSGNSSSIGSGVSSGSTEDANVVGTPAAVISA
jgi:transcription initiation factor TFIID subunit TAF12